MFKNKIKTPFISHYTLKDTDNDIKQENYDKYTIFQRIFSVSKGALWALQEEGDLVLRKVWSMKSLRCQVML